MTDQNNPVKFAWLILILLFFSQCIMSLGTYVWGPLGPYLVSSLGLSLTQIGSCSSAFFLVASLVATPMGILVDKFSTKLILVCALTLMGFSFFAIGMSNSYLFILLFAALAGTSYGVINQVSVKDLGLWFPKNLRGFVFGIRQSGVTLGAAAGSVIITVIASIKGWQTAVWFAGGLMLLMAFLCFVFYKSGEVSTPKSEPKQRQHVKTQTSHVFKIMKQPEIMASSIIGFFMGGSQVVISTFLIIYLKDTQMFPENVFLSIFLTVVMLSAAVGRIGWGIISDQVFKGDRLKSIIIISLVATLSAIGLLFVQPGAPVFIMYVISALLGISFIGFQGVWFACVSDTVPVEYSGVITGIMVTISWLGIVTLPILFGVIADQINYFWSWMIIVIAGTLSMAFSGYFYWQRKNINENLC